MQTATNTSANLFAAAATMPTAVCVTAFIAPQSLIELSIYADGSTTTTGPQIISVGTYMSDRSIWHICNFTNAANALNYAFMLKGENCPISKNAFALLRAEIKRTNAVSTRAKKAAEAKAAEKAEAKAKTEAAESEKKAEAEKVEVIKADEPKRSASVAATPLMKQYAEMKKKHPDAVLLFRVGDFYETFADDAVTASEVLGITLTRRANGKAKSIELAGFPHHALDAYLPKLVRAGKRVAICEQLDEPKKKKVKTSAKSLGTKNA